MMEDWRWQSFMRRARRGLWLLPMVAALLFVAGVLGWVYRSENEEALERRATMIADALSTEAQLRSRLDIEAAHLEDLARQLSSLPHRHGLLAAQPEVVQGLRGLWLGVTWLDTNNRIIEHTPKEPLPPLASPAPPPAHIAAELLQDPTPSRPVGHLGLSSHLTHWMGGETLVVRYAPALLLSQGVPWWVTRKYEVRLVDASEQVIASSEAPPLPSSAPASQSYRVQVGKNMPGAYLELTLRDAPRAFWRSLPWVLVCGFLVLMCIATLLLRQQVRIISAAKRAWRTEAAWRRAMEDSALVGLRARDTQGRIVYVNRTFCDMVGLTAQQLVGSVPPMPYWPPDAIEEVMQRHQRNLSGQAPREGYEAQWCHQDGRRLTVMVFESPLIGAHGTHIGWMGSIIDITAHKQLEARQRQQAEAQARQSRLSTLGEIASALAHQLNQPLTAIMGYNAGLQRMLSHSDAPPLGVSNTSQPTQQHTMLQALQRQGEQAALAGSIVRHIREFLTRRGPQREACDLLQTARRAAELLQHDFSQQRIRLQWVHPPALPAVYADPVLIEQVLINLLRNAADALQTQAPAHAPTQPTVRITLSYDLRPAHDPRQALRVDLEDNGLGLQGCGMEQLSAPFYSTKPEGMGMGLSICRSVIESHHGSLGAGPSPLGGAHFYFTLPVLDSAHPCAPPDPQPAAHSEANVDANANAALLVP